MPSMTLTDVLKNEDFYAKTNRDPYRVGGQGGDTGTMMTGNAALDTAFPGGWGKSSRQSKTSFLMGRAENAIDAGGAEAKRLTEEEERRGGAMEKIIKDSLPAANAPTMTDESIRLAMSDRTDEAARRTNASMSMLRSQLGGAGVTGGGMAAGLASQVELARQGQITDSRRSLYIEKVRSDAIDRARNFQNNLVYANAVNRDVSMIEMDWLTGLAGLRQNQLGGQQAANSAKDAANAAEDAGWMGFAGGIAQGGLGALAGIV